MPPRKSSEHFLLEVISQLDLHDDSEIDNKIGTSIWPTLVTCINFSIYCSLETPWVAHVVCFCPVGYSVAVGEFTGDSEQGEHLKLSATIVLTGYIPYTYLDFYIKIYCTLVA